MENEFLKRITEKPLDTVIDYYASCLPGAPKAVQLVNEELDLTTDQAASQRIGFSDRTLGKQLPSNQCKAGREIRAQLQSLGLYKENGRETLRGYVTIPILNDQGTVIGIRGHQVGRHAKGPAEIVVDKMSQPIETTLEVAPPLVKEQPSDESTTNLTIDDDNIIFTCDDRRYRVRGLERNNSCCQMRVSLMVSRDELVHLDSLDLVKARSRSSFIKAAASELFTDSDDIKRDIGQLLLKLETLQSERIEQFKKPKDIKITLSQEEQDEALKLLRDPKLLQRIVTDIGVCGMVGEETNKLAGYLAALSRKLDAPLAIMIQSSSSAGKTSLMDAILAMVPEEDQLRFSGMTGQSLFYLESDALHHKILAISEEEGIAQSTYALKLLQSEGELCHATVGKNPQGRMGTQRNKVKGPVQVFLTTTAMEIDEELFNRCMILTVDETRQQTEAIQRLQRNARTLSAMQTSLAAKEIRTLHQNAQRLLRPLKVVNPYAPQLTFANEKTRLRRDHQKYLTLIDTIALLHQHQRQVHSATSNGRAIEYINVTPSDIAVANGIAAEVLGRSLDELSPQTRTFLILLHQHIGIEAKAHGLERCAVRFTRRDVRESSHWSDFQVRTHLKKLVELEYVIAHRGKNGKRFVYELLYDGQGSEGQPFLIGLIDPSKLQEPASSSMPITTTLSIDSATLSI